MSFPRRIRQLTLLLFLGLAGALGGAEGPAAEPGLLFYLSGEKGTTADFSAGGTPEPNNVAEITPIADGAKGAALSCGDFQRLFQSRDQRQLVLDRCLAAGISL